MWTRCLCIPANRVWKIRYLRNSTHNIRSYEGTHSTHIDCTDYESFGVSHGRPKGKVLLDLQARCVCHRRLVTILIAHTSQSKLAGVKLLH